MRPKILILFCGGTMVMVRGHDGSLQPPSSENVLSSVLSFEPRLKEIADIAIHYIINIDSSDMTPRVWDEIASVINKEHDHYDGFVLIHGTDTMAYTASAVSFALQNIGKPVVFTGAQIPGHFLESDARHNLINALRVAAYPTKGVMVLFGDRIIQGVRSSKVSHTKLDAFDSVNHPKMGQVGTKLEFFRESNRTREKPLFLPGFESRIVSLSLIPGMPVDVLFHFLEGEVKGVILSAYGTGNIPAFYLPFLQKAQERSIPVVIRSQCAEGRTNMSLYASGQRALDYGAIEAHDMSREATTTKLMWALYRAKSLEEIQTIMHKNYVGEIHIPL
jgi:L-asparaginase